MKENTPFRDFMVGAFCMLLVIAFVHRTSDEYKQYVEIKNMTAECEKNLPRSENCVIVALPKSKD
jgi:hypothetical protein